MPNPAMAMQAMAQGKQMMDSMSKGNPMEMAAKFKNMGQMFKG